LRHRPTSSAPAGPAAVLGVSYRVSPLPPSPRSLALPPEPAGRRPVHAGMSCPGWGHCGLGLLGQRGLHVGLGPHRLVSLGQLDPGAKSPCTLFLFPETFQNCCKSCKIHRILSVYQKKVYYISKCSVKCNLQVYVQCMHD
jgi:hypothetical protein